VQIGKLEAGAAWIKHTTDWREYLSVKLDDPTLPGRSSPASSKRKAAPTTWSGAASVRATGTDRPQAPPANRGAFFFRPVMASRRSVPLL
jgi:hypothetical protein